MAHGKTRTGRRGPTANNTILSGREYITTVTVPSGTKPGTPIFTSPVTPLAFPGTRLAQMASLWDTYKFARFAIHVGSRAPTTSAGGYMAAIIPDPTFDPCSADTTCLTRTIRAASGMAAVPLWRSATATYNGRKDAGKYLVGTTGQAQAQALVAVDAGGLGCTPETCSYPLTIDISYTVHFSGPAANCAPCGQTYQATCQIPKAQAPVDTPTTTASPTTPSGPQSTPYSAATPAPAETQSQATERAKRAQSKIINARTMIKNIKATGLDPSALINSGILPIVIDRSSAEINAGGIYHIMSTTLSDWLGMGSSMTVQRAAQVPVDKTDITAQVTDTFDNPNWEQMILDATSGSNTSGGKCTRYRPEPALYLLIPSPRVDLSSTTSAGSSGVIQADRLGVPASIAAFNGPNDQTIITFGIIGSSLDGMRGIRSIWRQQVNSVASLGNDLAVPNWSFGPWGAMTPGTTYGTTGTPCKPPARVVANAVANDGILSKIYFSLSLLEFDDQIQPVDKWPAQSMKAINNTTTPLFTRFANAFSLTKPRDLKADHEWLVNKMAQLAKASSTRAPLG